MGRANTGMVFGRNLENAQAASWACIGVRCARWVCVLEAIWAIRLQRWLLLFIAVAAFGVRDESTTRAYGGGACDGGACEGEGGASDAAI